MSPTLANFLFEVANFSILTAVLARVFFKPVRNALDSERAAHNDAAAQSEAVRRQAEALATEARASAERARAGLEAEHATIAAQARAETSALLEQARAEEVRARDKLAAELTAERAAAVHALRREVALLAADAVRRLLIAVDGPALEHALVRAACTQLQALPASSRERALIEGAHALDAESRQLLESALPSGFDYRELAELGAGLRITTCAGQVDVSAASFARQASRAVRLAGEAGHG